MALANEFPSQPRRSPVANHGPLGEGAPRRRPRWRPYFPFFPFSAGASGSPNIVCCTPPQPRAPLPLAPLPPPPPLGFLAAASGGCGSQRGFFLAAVLGACCRRFVWV